MTVLFERSFAKDIRILREHSLRTAIQKTIASVKESHSLNAMPQCKKLRGYENVYRLRCGDYRIGITLEGDEVTFVRCLHRKELYKYFP